MNSLNTVTKQNPTPQYVMENRANSTSYVIDTKPAQELYVENTNMPPPAHFYYINPQQSLSTSQLHNNQHKTYIVNSGETVIPMQQVIIRSPIVHPSALFSAPTVNRQTPVQILSDSSIDRSVQRSYSGIRTTSDMVSRAEYEKCQN
jgi:hypothetical protein